MNIDHQHDTRTQNERGFSLIDVAVVMAIVGILLAGFLATYKMYQATRASTVTEENFMAAQEALGAFVANWNRYPAPAAFGLTTGDTKYGVGGDPAAAVNCTSASNANGKICKGDGVTEGATTYEVLVGVLPFADINLPDSQARDGYGRLFTYAVSAELVKANGADPVVDHYRGEDTDGDGEPDTDPVYTYLVDTDGDGTKDAVLKYNYHVCVKTQDLDDAGAINVNGCTDAMGTNPPRAIALVSHGADGIGAWLPTGRQYMPCGPTTGAYPSTSQNENCNFDGTFVQAMRLRVDGGIEVRQPMQVRGDNVNKNDDTIQVELREGGNYWGDNAAQISNKYNYKVGIGVADPKAALDVAGNIKAPLVMAKKLCEEGDNPTSDAGCLDVKSLAGAKDEMDCGVGMVKGFENNKAVCIYPAEPKTCLEGEYISGVDATGNVVCTPFPASCGPAHDTYATTAPSEADKCSKGTAGTTTGTGPWSWTCDLGGQTVNCATKTGTPPPEPTGPGCIDECGEQRHSGQTWCNRGYPHGKRKCESNGAVTSQGCISGIGCCSGGTLQCN